jgi:NADP-dependent 3-hydroxy acid dehydrogenase YdfG
MQRVAVVTGASSGIGAATARRLAAEGFHLVLGARRLPLLREVGEPLGARCLPLDVTDPASVATFCEAVGDTVHVLVNNAGGALGLDPVRSASDADWAWMYDANVLGTLRMTRGLLPALEASAGHIVMMGSVAGFEPYPGGAGYNAAKFALRAMTQVLRMELLGVPVRLTEIDPGMVAETEFSLVRFGGDEDRAAKVYEGVEPLTADDVADCVAFAVTRPPHVNIDEIVVKPLDQANVRMVHRRPAAPQEGAR